MWMQNSLSFFRKSLPLIIIFVVAFIFRTLWLGTLPATFFVDEVLSGYLGRYLWLNGMDLYGNPYPLLYFNKFGDYYIILPMYLDGLSTFIFGVTRFATRFPTALIGALAVFPIYGIAKRIFDKPIIGYLAALLLALAPWHVVLSRATTESIIEFTVIVTIVWTLIESLSRKQLRWLGLAGLCSFLSYFIYHTARITVPLIWLGYVLILFFEPKKKTSFFLTALFCTVIAFALTIGIGQTEWGRGRFEQTSIFSVQSGVSIRMQEMTYNLGHDSVLLARIFHNKIIGYSREFINQYFHYFSPLFLFSDYAWLKTRYGVPETGPLYLSMLLMLIICLLPSTAKLTLQKSGLLLLFWWIAVAPLPAALTVIESPNVRRSVLLMAPLAIFAALGWYKSFFISFKKINLGYFLSLFLLGEVILFSYLYSKQSDAVSSLYRSDVQPEIAKYLIAKQDQADEFVIFKSYDFPLYYLFETNDFSAHWASTFQDGLKIEQMGSVRPVEFQCSNQMSAQVRNSYSENTLFIEPQTCEIDICHFEEVDRVVGVNKLLYFKVLRKIDQPPSDVTCAI